MLAQTLKLEAPEAELSQTDVRNLSEHIESLVEMISEAEVRSDLKALLLRHATFMSWAIRNIGFVGFQEVYEAALKMMVAAQRLPNDTKRKKTVRTKIAEMCKTVFRTLQAAEAADRGTQAIGHLVEEGQNLLDAF